MSRQPLKDELRSIEDAARRSLQECIDAYNCCKMCGTALVNIATRRGDVALRCPKDGWGPVWTR